MAVSNLREEIGQRVEAIRLVDTHEHLISEEQRASMKLDLFHWFCQYAASDLVSAGMPASDFARFRDSSVPLDERWALFEPYWRYTRTTGYGRALSIAALTSVSR